MTVNDDVNENDNDNVNAHVGYYDDIKPAWTPQGADFRATEADPRPIGADLRATEAHPRPTEADL
jgi:hypothetical protein